MSIGEEIDRLAAEGRLSSVMVARRAGGGWQCYLKLGHVDSYVVQIADTPTAALTKAIEKLPSCEAYDLKYSAEAVTERAKNDPSSANGRPAEMTNDGSIPSEGTTEAGIFD